MNSTIDEKTVKEIQTYQSKMDKLLKEYSRDWNSFADEVPQKVLQLLVGGVSHSITQNPITTDSYGGKHGSIGIGFKNDTTAVTDYVATLPTKMDATIERFYKAIREMDGKLDGFSKSGCDTSALAPLIKTLNSWISFLENMRLKVTDQSILEPNLAADIVKIKKKWCSGTKGNTSQPKSSKTPSRSAPKKEKKVSFDKGCRVNAATLNLALPDSMKYISLGNAGDFSDEERTLMDSCVLVAVPDNYAASVTGYQDAPLSVKLHKPQDLGILEDAWSSEGKPLIEKNLKNNLISSINWSGTPNDSFTSVKSSFSDIAMVYTVAGGEGGDQAWIAYAVAICHKTMVYIGMIYFNEKGATQKSTEPIVKQLLEQIQPADEEVEISYRKDALGSFAGKNGKIDAIQVAKLFSGDYIFNNDSEIQMNNGKHIMTGLQFNSAKAFEHPELLQRSSSVIPAVLGVASFLERNKKLSIAKTKFSKKLLPPTWDQPITGITFLNFCAWHMIVIADGDAMGEAVKATTGLQSADSELDCYTIALDQNLIYGMPDAYNVVAEFIKTLRLYNGITESFNATFVATRNLDVPVDITVANPIKSAAPFESFKVLQCEGHVPEESEKQTQATKKTGIEASAKRKSSTKENAESTAVSEGPVLAKAKDIRKAAASSCTKLKSSWQKTLSEYRRKVHDARSWGGAEQAARTVDDLVSTRNHNFGNTFESIISKIDSDGKQLLGQNPAFEPLEEIYNAIVESYAIAQDISFSIQVVMYDYLKARGIGWYDVKAGTYHPSDKAIAIKRWWREKYISMPESKEGRKRKALEKALEDCKSTLEKELNRHCVAISGNAKEIFDAVEEEFKAALELEHSFAKEELSKIEKDLTDRKSELATMGLFQFADKKRVKANISELENRHAHLKQRIHTTDKLFDEKNQPLMSRYSAALGTWAASKAKYDSWKKAGDERIAAFANQINNYLSYIDFPEDYVLASHYPQGEMERKIYDIVAAGGCLKSSEICEAYYQTKLVDIGSTKIIKIRTVLEKMANEHALNADKFMNQYGYGYQVGGKLVDDTGWTVKKAPVAPSFNDIFSDAI